MPLKQITSVKQAYGFGWMLLVILAGLAGLLCGAGLWVLGRQLQASQAVESHLVGYQIASERQHGLVSILANGESLARYLDGSFLKPAPDRLLSFDGFSGRADDRQRSALVLEVLNEGDFYFSVLVSQGHLNWLLKIYPVQFPVKGSARKRSEGPALEQGLSASDGSTVRPTHFQLPESFYTASALLSAGNLAGWVNGGLPQIERGSQWLS